MTNDEGQMTKEIRNPKSETRGAYYSRPFSFLDSSFGLLSSFGLRHSSFAITYSPQTA